MENNNKKEKEPVKLFLNNYVFKKVKELKDPEESVFDFMREAILNKIITCEVELRERLYKNGGKKE